MHTKSWKHKIKNYGRNCIPGSVADPYHFDTDPDPGYEKICYVSGSGSRVNFDTDPYPGKNNMDPDLAKKD